MPGFHQVLARLRRAKMEYSVWKNARSAFFHTLYSIERAPQARAGDRDGNQTYSKVPLPWFPVGRLAGRRPRLAWGIGEPRESWLKCRCRAGGIHRYIL